MMLGIGVLLLLIGVLIFGAPFIEYLAPSSQIILVDVTDSTNPILLAQGANTLWYQWQIWGYLVIATIMIVSLCALITNYVKTYTDERISERIKQLSDQIVQNQKEHREFKEKTQKELKQSFDREQKEVDERYEQVRYERIKTEELHNKTVQLKIEMTNLNKRQIKEVDSKLAQRDRLSEQKKQISNFLNTVDWKLNEETKLTYQLLLKLSQNK